MIKYILFISLCFITFISAAQNADTSFNYIAEIKYFFGPSTDTTPKFLLFVTPQNNLSKDYLEKISLKDTIFSPSDIDFVLYQVSQGKGIIWNNDLIPNASLITKTALDSVFKRKISYEGWQAFYEKYGSYYYVMSLPYFSRDKNTCIVFTENRCGSLCSSGEMQIFKKKQSKWFLYKTVETWTS